MSFLTDLFEGHTSNLGTDLSHAGSSLMSHPSELYETLGGAAALATGGLALGGLGGGLFGGADAAAGGGGLFSGLFGGGDAAAAAAGGDAFDIGAATQGSDIATGIAANPAYGGGSLGAAGDIGATGVQGAVGGGAGVDATAGLPGGAYDISAASEGSGIAQGIAANPAYSGPPSGGFWNTLTSPSQWTLGGVGKVAGVAAAGAGLGMDVLNRNQMDPNQAMLAQQAAQLGQSGQVLESYLKTGKLPPALQAQLDQAVAAEKARIVSGYAAKGMPTDPNQNSALAQDLNNVQTNAIAAMANVQVEMMNTGLKETGLSSQLYQMLTQLDLQQNKDLMSAISSFAAALGGGMGGGQNVKLSLA
jgi:hypothetical protein